MNTRILLLHHSRSAGREAGRGRLMKVILMLLVMFSLAGCGSRAVYENIQINKRNECLKLPPSAYEECMEGVNKPYDEYEKERREIINE